MDAKYIVILQDSTGTENVVLVPPWRSHSDGFTDHGFAHGSGRAVAAGFFGFSIENGRVVVNCWGQSISLKVSNRGERDERLISRFLGADANYR